ncbi:ABC transporter permease [Hyphomicrobium sp. CS1BSMeth3]|uniref:ABC transporter permease n=1 Tax=Hyphomicrobium sp. CS1BSMeth3 TaxID=1892844 RepID=UPI0009FA114D|nr:ABC transporter permease [Hyphomicrobium sp. CS1BSMeth3]
MADGTAEASVSRLPTEADRTSTTRTLGDRIEALPNALRVGVMLFFWLAVWYGVVELFAVSKDFLPNPIDVISRIVRLAWEPVGAGPLLTHAWASIVRLLWGFGAAIVIGVPLGLAMAYFRPLQWIVAPLFELFRYIPPIAWAPFAMFWFGAGSSAQAYVIFTSSFAPILINSFRGVQLVDSRLIDAARTLGAKSWTILFEVALPAALPHVVTGLRIGLATGWMALIAAEIVAGTGSRDGLGYLILQGQQQLHADLTIGAMVLIGILGSLIDLAIRAVEGRFAYWRS